MLIRIKKLNVLSILQADNVFERKYAVEKRQSIYVRDAEIRHTLKESMK